MLLKDITEFDKEICKIAGFIFLEKYEKYREDYFANELKYYPNIRYKIYNLYEQRENREKLWHLSEKCCQRIEGIFIAYIGLEMLLFMQGKAINEYKC